jgi:hypothetical protein
MILGCSMTGSTAPPTSTALPIPSPASQSTGQTIQFKSGATSATVTGQLTAKGTDKWVVNGQAGQTFAANLTFSSGTAALVITDRNGKTVLDAGANATTYSTVLASTQDYEVDVVAGDQATSYTLTVTVENAPKQTNQRIEFKSGATSATVTGQVAANSADYWIVNVKAGQKFSVNLTLSGGEAGLTMAGADGSLPQQDSPTSFKDVLSTGQDYDIHVVGNPTTTTPYSLTVDIH